MRENLQINIQNFGVVMCEISERIRNLRNERGIKAGFVAQKVGLSNSMISAIERGKCNPTIPQAIAIANFFGVSMDYLLLGK
jgi:transcriptional regulator with XRE-family HTH domain